MGSTIPPNISEGIRVTIQPWSIGNLTDFRRHAPYRLKRLLLVKTRFRRPLKGPYFWCAFMPLGAGHGGMALHGESLIAVYPAMGVLASFRRQHQRPVLAV